MLQTELQITYPSDLTDSQWEIIKNYLPVASSRGRPRKVSLRAIINAIFYINRTGCPWRYLPKTFPNWNTVFDYYKQWQRDGTIKEIHDQLVKLVRVKEQRNPLPYRCIIDSQSSKARWGENRGYDGFKKVIGRKRSIVVDTLGLIHHIHIDSALEKDHKSAIKMFLTDLRFTKNKFPRLKELYADGGYKSFEWYMQAYLGIDVILNISKKTTIVQGKEKNYKPKKNITSSNLKPVRWVVERTFAWFNNFRRLARDYEKTVKSSITMVFVAMTQLMLNRLSELKRPRWV